ncbi:MAG TPA: M14 family zinc carboxypeptidase [Armatimonadota bacterium]|jgi:hypothetical protein
MPPASADIVREILARVPASPRSLTQLNAALAALPATGRCRLHQLALTSQGRPLVMAEVTDFSYPGPKATIFIIGRQHGSEAAGSESTLAILQQFAEAPTPLEQDILKYLRILAVPVANPDGAAINRRANANGVDLNRDWAQLTQVETRAITAAIALEKPQAVVDLHELPASSGKASYQENFLETIGACPAIPTGLSRRTKAISTGISTWLHTLGYPLNVYYDYPGDSLALCHRQLGLHQKFPTFLCEAKNGAGRTLPVRAGFHVVSVLVIANYLMHDGVTESAAPAAAAPAATPPPPSGPAPAAPVQMTVSFQPEAAPNHRKAQLHVQVEGGDSFSYVEVAVGGRTRALSNLRENTWPLDLGTLPVGRHPVTVTAYGAGDTEIATRQLAVEVTENSVVAAR